MNEEKFIFGLCNIHDLDEIIKIQDEVFTEEFDTDLLRKNSKNMLKECLSGEHITIGAWHNNLLVAFSILYIPYDDEENLANSLVGIDTSKLKTANYKLCIVRKKYRGNSLQYILATKLEQYAKSLGIDLLCVTASPKNTYSIYNITRLGYKYNRTLIKYNLERELYYKFIKNSN